MSPVLGTGAHRRKGMTWRSNSEALGPTEASQSFNNHGKSDYHVSCKNEPSNHRGVHKWVERSIKVTRNNKVWKCYNAIAGVPNLLWDGEKRVSGKPPWRNLCLSLNQIQSLMIYCKGEPGSNPETHVQPHPLGLWKRVYAWGSWEITHYLLPARYLTLNNYVEIMILVNSYKQRIILSSWIISSFSNPVSNLPKCVHGSLAT